MPFDSFLYFIPTDWLRLDLDSRAVWGCTPFRKYLQWRSYPRFINGLHLCLRFDLYSYSGMRPPRRRGRRYKRWTQRRQPGRRSACSACSASSINRSMHRQCWWPVALRKKNDSIVGEMNDVAGPINCDQLLHLLATNRPGACSRSCRSIPKQDRMAACIWSACRIFTHICPQTLSNRRPVAWRTTSNKKHVWSSLFCLFLWSANDLSVVCVGMICVYNKNKLSQTL